MHACRSTLEDPTPRNIIITGAKRDTADRIGKISAELADQLRAAGNTVIVLGDFMRPGINLVDCTEAPGFLVSDAWIKERCKGDAKAARRELYYNTTMTKLVPGFISPNDIQCPKGVCQFFNGSKLLYRDDHHLNNYGSSFFMAKLKPLLPF